jgi:hypothetical protein
MTKNEILDDFLEKMDIIDYGCNFWDCPSDDVIYFDDDSRGNGNGPFIKIKFYKNYAKILCGDSLKSNEKKIKFTYESTDQFVDNLSGFLRKYFKSFKYTRKRI